MRIRTPVELEFGDDAEGRLVNVDVDALEVTIGGVRPLGLSEDEAASVLEEVGTIELDPEMSDGERSAYRLAVTPRTPAAGGATASGGDVVLWFSGGICDAISAAAGVDAEGFYVWPERD